MSTWKKINAGEYRLVGTRYGVASEHVNLDDDLGSFGAAKEWAVVRLPSVDVETVANDGENLDWLPTMREAKAECERLAAKEE